MSLSHRLTTVVIVLLGGVLWNPKATAQPPAALVQVDAVRSEGTAEAVRVVGQVVPVHAGNIAARTLGTVVDGPLAVGTSVNAGDTIARLAGLTQKSNLAEAQANLAEAQARLQLVTSQRDRARRLSGTKAIDEDTLQQRESAVQTARAALDRAAVDLERAKTDLGFVTIKAPFTGVITAHLTNLGAWVNRGDTVVQMVSTADLWLEMGIPSAIASQKLPPKLRWESDSGRHGEATVYALLPSENPLARTRTLRATVSADSGLLPYAPVTVEVRAANESSPLSVHKDAIVRTLDGPTVFVASDGHAESRSVNLGSAIGSRFVVVEGLQEGELVVVRGNERLRPGQAIRYPNAE